MNKLRIMLAAAVCGLALTAPAQDTNTLKTDLAVFEAQTGIIIVKGHGPTSTLSVGPVAITVVCKVSTDISTGRSADGLAIEIGENPQSREKFLVDYDEIDALLNSISYLSQINYEVTPLPGFEASYSTKSGLRMVAGSIRKQGAVQTYLEYDPGTRVALSSVQMAQLYGFIQQAKKELDTIRASK